MIVPSQELQQSNPVSFTGPDQTHMLMALGQMNQQGQLPQNDPGPPPPMPQPRVSGRVRGAHKVLRMR